MTEHMTGNSQLGLPVQPEPVTGVQDTCLLGTVKVQSLCKGRDRA